MVQVLVFETQTFAMELYSLLKDLDPVRWKEEKKQNFKERVLKLENEVNRLIHVYASEFQQKVQKHRNISAISDKLHNLRELISELKNSHLEDKETKGYLHFLRKRMEMGYHELALIMETHSVKLPSLRPTNYARSAFHILSATIALVLIEIVPSPVYLIFLALAFTTFSWAMEILRRVNDHAREKLMSFFGPVIHHHEYQKINSATWYSTALILLSLTLTPVLSAVAVTVLGLSDPVAAAIGRKFGKIKIFSGRTLEGSLTFFIVGTFSTFVLLSNFHPVGSNLRMLIISACAGLFGAVGELFGKYPDDNLTIPLSSALGTFIALLIF